MSEVISVDVINSIPPTLYTSKHGELEMEIQSNTTNSIDLTNKNLNF